MTVVQRVLKWLQKVQAFVGKVDEQLIAVLQPYLTTSTEILKIQALLAISLSSNVVESTKHDFLVMTTQDMNYLKTQLCSEKDFSSKEVLDLLLSISFLPQNLEIMSSGKVLETLSMILEGDDNIEEQEIAARLIQSIVDFEASTEVSDKKVLPAKLYIASYNYHIYYYRSFNFRVLLKVVTIFKQQELLGQT